jgi:hypothetical protein
MHVLRLKELTNAASLVAVMLEGIRGSHLSLFDSEGGGE